MAVPFKKFLRDAFEWEFKVGLCMSAKRFIPERKLCQGARNELCSALSASMVLAAVDLQWTFCVQLSSRVLWSDPWKR